MFMTPAGDSGKTINVFKSLRLRKTPNSYLGRTTFPAGTSNTKFTLSFWVKRGLLTSGSPGFLGSYPSSNRWSINFYNGGDQIYLYHSGGYNVSNRVLRDPAAWYHVVWVFDASQPASRRNRMWVNNEEVTWASVTNGAATHGLFNSTANHSIGSDPGYLSSSYHADSAFSQIHYIDGQALLPTAFAAYDEATGQWLPIKYAGAYGTNGFRLAFEDGTSVTALGYDTSGGANHWTPMNMSDALTSGPTYDWLDDTPSNNFAILSPLTPKNPSGQTYSCFHGNLAVSTSGAPYNALIASSMAVSSGKWYAEVTVQSALGTTAYNGTPYGGIIGLSNEKTNFSNFGTGTATPCWLVQSSGYKSENGTSALFGTAGWNIGDVFGLAIDMDNKTLDVYKNGVLVGTPFNTLSGAVSLIVGGYGSNYTVNFGQQPFKYTAPTGFKKLCSQNMTDSAVIRGEKYFKARTYLGNGGSLQVGEVQKAIDLTTIAKSLRFNSADASYLSRMHAAGGSTQKWSYATWFKMSAMTDARLLASAYIDAYSYGLLTVTSTGTVVFFDVRNANPGSGTGPVSEYTYLESVEKISTGDWKHIVCIVDTTQATASNRVKIFVNGVQLTLTNTAWGAGSYATTYPALNKSLWLNSNRTHYIGANGSPAAVTNGYMADVNFVDGLALLPTDFGQWDANGYWVAKSYTGAYGVNGFHLEFLDSSSTASSALGKDTSGNGNNWTTNGFSVLSGSTMDVLSDSPTNNFSVLSPLDAKLHTISDGGLKMALATASNPRAVRGTLGVLTGKYYYEAAPQAGNSSVSSYGVGTRLTETNASGWPTDNSVEYFGNGSIAIGDTSVAAATVATYTAGDIVGVAFDAGTGYVAFYKNGVMVWSGYPLAPATANGLLYPFMTNNNTGDSSILNFGQRPFAYAPPSGFVELCENNIAEYTYDVDTPDLVWIKNRAAVSNHALFDVNRGPKKYWSTNLTAADTTDENSLVQFDRNGFVLGPSAVVNTVNVNYAAWTWKMGGAPVANNAGSIASQVSANPLAGMSVVSYTGNGAANATVGHGLGGTPEMYLMHSPAGASGNNPMLYTVVDGSLDYAYVNSNGAGANATQAAPTSSVFNVISGADNVNGASYIAYCFRSIPGFSKFGTYVGNGSSDGTFVNLGFRPAFIMVKRIDSTGEWAIYDTARDTVNGAYLDLLPNQNYVENSATSNISDQIDLVSNGFKFRNYISGSHNHARATFVYAAFAECPFKNANAR
jgi:hypothetical protein